MLQKLVGLWTDIVDYVSFDPERIYQTDMVARFVLQIILLAGSAFFSGSETALFSLSRLDLQNLRRNRHPRSEALHALLDEPRQLIISILCGNELVNIAAATNLAGIMVALYGEGNQATIINIVLMVPLALLFGEVTPKTIAVSNPVRISANLVAGPMHLWIKVVAPARWIIRGIADQITTMLVGEQPAKDNILHVDEFRSLVADISDEGVLDATERVLIYNLLEAGDTEIVEIMTPRTKTKFLNITTPVSEMVEQFRLCRHPRVPVFEGHRDNLVGFLHAEDIMRLVLDDVDLSELDVQDIIHPPVVVPLTKKVDEMFDFFQAKNARAAAVLNEFGGVEGFVTMKDVLTFIFGQISEDVAGQELYRERDENMYVVPGDMKLTDFNNLTNFGIEDPRMTTIGGVAFRHLDRLPQEGDEVVVEGFIIKILEMDEHRIAKVQVLRSSGGRSIMPTPNDNESIESADTTSSESGKPEVKGDTDLQQEKGKSNSDEAQSISRASDSDYTRTAGE